MDRMHTPSDTVMTTSSHRPWRGWQRAALWLVVAAVLALVFSWYQDPQFMLTMADTLWACF